MPNRPPILPSAPASPARDEGKGYDLLDRDGERYVWSPHEGMWRHDEVNGTHYERQQIERDWGPVREVPRDRDHGGGEGQ